MKAEITFMERGWTGESHRISLTIVGPSDKVDEIAKAAREEVKRWKTWEEK